MFSLGNHEVTFTPSHDLVANGHTLIKPSMGVIKFLLINNNVIRRGETEGELEKQLKLLPPLEQNTLKNFYASVGVYSGTSQKYTLLSNLIGSGLKGQGLRVAHAVQYYKNLDELVDRLNIIIASKQAGNTSNDLKTEASEIISKLLVAKKITRNQSKKLYSLII